MRYEINININFASPIQRMKQKREKKKTLDIWIFFVLFSSLYIFNTTTMLNTNSFKLEQFTQKHRKKCNWFLRQQKYFTSSLHILFRKKKKMEGNTIILSKNERKVLWLVSMCCGIISKLRLVDVFVNNWRTYLYKRTQLENVMIKNSIWLYGYMVGITSIKWTTHSL